MSTKDDCLHVEIFNFNVDDSGPTEVFIIIEKSKDEMKTFVVALW